MHENVKMVAVVVEEVVTEMTGTAVIVVVATAVEEIETIVVSNVERVDISVANVPMEGIGEDTEEVVAVIEAEAEI